MIEKINVNQINMPLGSYSAQQYTFTEKYFYSGYIYNASSQNSLTIQITLTEGNVLPNIIIPANAILKIENLTIFQMNISDGYYTFSFIGSNIGGIPKIDVNPQNVIVNSFPYSTNGLVYAVEFQVTKTTTSSGQPLPQPLTYYFDAENKLLYEIILKALPNNTDYIYISGYHSGTFGFGYRLAPGEDLYLYMVNPAQIYVWTTTSDQTLEVLMTGSGGTGQG